MVSCGISTSFPVLFPSKRKVAHALLTRPPLKHLGASSSMSPLDLHVLGTPPAFVLSQDQTLPFNPIQTLKLFPVLKLNSSESLSLLIALLSFNLYRFQGSPHSLSQVPDYIITTPPFCQALFSSFLKVFSLYFNFRRIKAPLPEYVRFLAKAAWFLLSNRSCLFPKII